MMILLVLHIFWTIIGLVIPLMIPFFDFSFDLYKVNMEKQEASGINKTNVNTDSSDNSDKPNKPNKPNSNEKAIYQDNDQDEDKKKRRDDQERYDEDQNIKAILRRETGVYYEDAKEARIEYEWNKREANRNFTHIFRDPKGNDPLGITRR